MINAPPPHILDQYGKTILSFTTKESIEHTRGKTWFLVGGVITLLGVLYGILTDSMSFSILCILLAGVYSLTHNKPVADTEVRITDLGVVFRGDLHLYSAIRAFWIFWQPGELQTLNLAVTEGFFKELVIPVAGQDIARIREILSFHVQEVEGKRERFTDFLARKFKL
ncbi:MAG: hypothetical protein WCJ84_00815 [Candidatus Peregrinibacteria bacterium]